MRGSGAPLRATGTRDTVGALLGVLALGLALRLIIAYLLPGSGFRTDLDAFDYWARNLAAQGPYGFYDRPFFHDYTPGYLYALWFVGWLVTTFHLENLGDTIPFFQALGLKAVPILADLAIGWLVHSMIRELGGGRRVALAAAAVAVLNPVSWFDSVVWGQVDSVGVVFMLLGLRELWRDRPERAAVWTVVAAIIKPQLAILIPLVAVVTIRRALWPEGGEGDPARTGRPVRILTTGLAGFVTAVLLCLPFGLSVIQLTAQPPFIRSGLLEQVAVAAGGYPYLTVNAYNPWALFPSDTGLSLANSFQWVCDFAGSASPSTAGSNHCAFGSALVGPIPTVLIGSTLLVASMLAVLWLVARRPDRVTILVGLTVLALAFYVVPTRVHERYIYPFFALALILAAASPRWRVAYVALSAGFLANLYAILVTYPDNPSISDWFGIGPALLTEPAIAVVAIAYAIVFAWAFLWLARDVLRRRHPVPLFEPPAVTVIEEPERGSPIPAAGTDQASLDAVTRAVAPSGIRPSGRAASARLPSWSSRPSYADLGMVGWVRSRVETPPIRPDRTAVLRREPGGRLDRFDLWLLVALVLASLLLRTFRLAEPYQMHFDEVYHARTATEFLQDWRYDIDHNIYEWTHPHLAKYAMAAGLVLWGGDHVRATSDLGVPVRAAVIEPRRASAGSRDGRTV